MVCEDFFLEIFREETRNLIQDFWRFTQGVDMSETNTDDVNVKSSAKEIELGAESIQR